MELNLSRLFGLPAHPLVVHAVVVLVPLAALGLILVAVWPASRPHLLWATVAVAAAALVFTPLATSSGEALEEQVHETAAVEHHAELGDAMTAFSVALFAGAAGVGGLELVRRRRRRRRAGTTGEHWSELRAVTLGVSVFAVVVAVAATVQVAYVGHTGASATWESVQSGP